MERLFILVLCIVSVCAEKQLLHAVSGEVARGNYTYYSLVYEGPITLHLFSKLGDADLYISQKVSKPTFEPDTYCLQSSTCGLDIIHIPKNFHRPIGIGVYGHPSHELSIYLLEVFYRYKDETFDSPFDIEGLNDGDDNDEEDDIKKALHNSNPLVKKKKRTTDNTDNYDGHSERQESFYWNILWSFLDLLLEVIFF